MVLGLSALEPNFFYFLCPCIDISVVQFFPCLSVCMLVHLCVCPQKSLTLGIFFECDFLTGTELSYFTFFFFFFFFFCGGGGGGGGFKPLLWCTSPKISLKTLTKHVVYWLTKAWQWSCLTRQNRLWLITLLHLVHLGRWCGRQCEEIINFAFRLC